LCADRAAVPDRGRSREIRYATRGKELIRLGRTMVVRNRRDPSGSQPDRDFVDTPQAPLARDRRERVGRIGIETESPLPLLALKPSVT